MTTWSIATAAAPIALPRTNPVRLSGATRISRRKPLSRSDTTETPANSENQHRLRDDARVHEREQVHLASHLADVPPNPAPKMTRNRIGNTRLAAIRVRSLTKLSRSR